MHSESCKFEAVISGMNLPERCRKGTPENASWFLRNGIAPNREHPGILLAICHARRLARRANNCTDEIDPGQA